MSKVNYFKDQSHLYCSIKEIDNKFKSKNKQKLYDDNNCKMTTHYAKTGAQIKHF